MTDSRHYRDIATDIYRFTALRFAAEDLKRLHGVDERVSVTGYKELVSFYLLFLRSAAE
jgi:carboxypeptidase PM20D1